MADASPWIWSPREDHSRPGRNAVISFGTVIASLGQSGDWSDWFALLGGRWWLAWSQQRGGAAAAAPG